MSKYLILPQPPTRSNHKLTFWSQIKDTAHQLRTHSRKRPSPVRGTTHALPDTAQLMLVRSLQNWTRQASKDVPRISPQLHWDMMDV